MSTKVLFKFIIDIYLQTFLRLHFYQDKEFSYANYIHYNVSVDFIFLLAGWECDKWGSSVNTRMGRR